MALLIGDNFNYQGLKPNFERDRFLTLAEMKAYPETSLDDGHLSYCAEDGKRYEFKSTNSVDETTGKWREFKAGSDTVSWDSVTNKPEILGADEEDLTKSGDVLKFKNKEYDAENFSGLGRVYLRKNIQQVTIPKFDLTISTGCTTNGSITINETPIEVTTEASTPEDVALLIQAAISGTTVSGAVITFTSNPTVDYSTTGVSGLVVDNSYLESKNILTQDMINQPNTEYIILYDYDLNGATINIPEGCVLKFEGGSFSNGTIVGNNTTVINPNYANILIKGAFNNNVINNKYGNNIVQHFLTNEINIFQDINLLNSEVDNLGNSHIKRTAPININNGILNLIEHFTFDSGNYTIRFKDVTINFGDDDHDYTAFYGGDDNDDEMPNIILENCTFNNNSIKRINNLLYNRFGTLTIINCTFNNCGIQVNTGDKDKDDFDSNATIYCINTVFKWNENLESLHDTGNSDCIAIGVRDNLFVYGCTFDTITNSCIDAYLGKNFIFINNKVINCNNGVELKSIFRESDWSNGSATGEHTVCNNYIISNNIVVNTPAFISLNTTFKPTNESDYTYFTNKKDKYKSNFIISNNTIYNNKSYDNTRYCIYGDIQYNTLIVDNVFKTTTNTYGFIRDKYVDINDTQLIKLFSENKEWVISNCIFEIPNDTTLFSIYYDKIRLDNCISVNEVAIINITNNAFDDIYVSLNNCKNFTINRNYSIDCKLHINLNNCDNCKIGLHAGIFKINNCRYNESDNYLMNITSGSSLLLNNLIQIYYITNVIHGQLSFNNKLEQHVLIDDISGITKGISTSLNSNYQFIKPFENEDERVALGIEDNIYHYYKLFSNQVIARYIYNIEINKWQYNGIEDTYNIIGTTEERPVLGTLYKGVQYFDTTLNKPIWWNGTEWVESGDSLPEEGTNGQVLTKTEDGYDWKDPQTGDAFPEGGTVGQVLKKTADGVEWDDDNDTIGCELSQISDLNSAWASKMKIDPTYLVPGNSASETTVPAVSIKDGSIKGYLLKNDLSTAVSIKDGSIKGYLLKNDLSTATSDSDGLMSSEDKNNLDALNSDVVTPNFVIATKGDIPMLCMMGTFESILYFVDSPIDLSGSISNITNTNGDYHLCLHIANSSVVGGGTGSADNNYYETACSASTDAFDSIEDFDKYFNKADNIVLKNDVIYHVTTSFTDHNYFVSIGINNATTVAKGFATLAEARAYMRQKMLAQYSPSINITKITQDEYDELGSKDSNTIYFIMG